MMSIKVLDFDCQCKRADSLYWCWMRITASIYPGPITFVISSVPLYVLITLNVSVFKLINFLLATNKEGQLGFLRDIYEVTRKRSRLWTAVARTCFCLPGNNINRTLFPHLRMLKSGMYTYWIIECVCFWLFLWMLEGSDVLSAWQNYRGVTIQCRYTGI